MPDRKSLITALWLASSLAVFASVLVAPMHLWRSATAPARPDCLRRNFALPPGLPTTRLSAVMVTGGVLEGNALPSEDEEQDGGEALFEPRVSFLTPYSFRKVLDRQSIALHPVLSLYPLRC